MSSEDQNDLIVRIKQNDAISDPDKQILTLASPGTIFEMIGLRSMNY